MISDSLDSLRELPSSRKKIRKRFFSVPALFVRTGKKKGGLLFSQNLSGRRCWILRPKDGFMPPKTDLDSGSDPVFFFGGVAPLRNGRVTDW